MDKNGLMYGVHTNEKIEKFVVSCDVSFLPNHNNINTHVHVRKTFMLFIDFITHCLLCVKQKF
jgi:hypothetical protein